MSRRTAPRPRRRAVATSLRTVAAGTPDDRFFRHLVGSMRNAVIAVHRDGRLALANDEAYRIFSLTPQPNDIGRPFSHVFRERPDAVRALSGAFDMVTLPNRAELRLKD